MSKDELHDIARQSTPENVHIPETWGGLAVWAVGKWGVGVVFLGLLLPVYADLKASNQQLAEVSKANVQVLTQLAMQVEAANARTSRIEDSIRQITLEIRDVKQ